MAFWDFLDPGSGYKDAMKQYSQGYQQGTGYLQPYYGAGTDQLQQLLRAQGSLMDPAALQSQWASGYEMSPYAQQMQKQAQQQGMDAAASMGLLGSSAALQNIQQTGADIMQKDRQQYLDDLMNKYLTGIGIGQNIYGTGAGAAGQLGQMGMQYGEGMAGLSYGEQQARNNMMMDLLKGAGKAGIGYGTGGMSGLASMF